MISYIGFDRTSFLFLHEYFVKEDPLMWENFRRQQRGEPRTQRVGRPQACDSYALLAVGLYYLVNQCREKVRLLCACCASFSSRFDLKVCW